MNDTHEPGNRDGPVDGRTAPRTPEGEEDALHAEAL